MDRVSLIGYYWDQPKVDLMSDWGQPNIDLEPEKTLRTLVPYKTLGIMKLKWNDLIFILRGNWLSFFGDTVRELSLDIGRKRRRAATRHSSGCRLVQTSSTNGRLGGPAEGRKEAILRGSIAFRNQELILADCTFLCLSLLPSLVLFKLAGAVDRFGDSLCAYSGCADCPA